MPSDGASADSHPLLRVDGLVKYFPMKGKGLLGGHAGEIRAVDGVSFELRRGETLGLVGESGCGKSTVAQTLLRLEEPTAGHAYFKGEDIFAMSRRRLRTFRREAQIVFQDPFESLNPRMTVGEIITEAWTIHPDIVPKRERRDRACALLEQVGLRPDYIHSYPGQFSGGQRQRIGVARALAVNPDVIVCDEPVSALDVSVQAQVLNLLAEIQDDLGLSYIFISHDLSVVRHISDRIAVMYLGEIVEYGTEQEIFTGPTHPYTQALLSAVPVAHPAARGRQGRMILSGDVPSPSNPPSGCRFRTRCWKAEAICADQAPELVDRFGHGHPSACHFAELRQPVAAGPPAEPSGG